MGIIPLDVQRRHERRWSARFSQFNKATTAEVAASIPAAGEMGLNRSERKARRFGRRALTTGAADVSLSATLRG
jgi:hypothetical protein